MSSKMVGLHTLKPNERNPRKITSDALKKLCESIERDPAFMEMRPIIIDESRMILGGNQRFSACQKLGMKSVPAAWVRTATGLTDEQRKRFILVDNAPEGMAGEWDMEILAAEWQMPELGDLGFDLDDLAASLPTNEDVDAEPQIDRAEELRKEWGVEADQIWELGDHRLLCGDSTKREDVDRLMAGECANVVLTDPPYGISLDTTYSNLTGLANSIAVKRGARSVIANTYRPVEGDSQPFDAAPLSAIFASASEQFWFGANYYRRTLPGDDLSGSWLVWDKRPSGWNADGEGIDDMIGAGFELIWSRNKHQQRVLRQQWSGFTARNPGLKRAHPTEKPVALLSDILTRWAPAEAVVADPFSGSGTTIIACEQLGRRCFAIEIDPGYVAVALQRFKDATGKTPTLEGHGS